MASICRICHSSSSFALIQPCACSGTQAYIHTSCLRQWRSHVKSLYLKDNCGICSAKYNIGLAAATRFKLATALFLTSIFVLGNVAPWAAHPWEPTIWERLIAGSTASALCGMLGTALDELHKYWKGWTVSLGFFILLNLLTNNSALLVLNVSVALGGLILYYGMLNMMIENMSYWCCTRMQTTEKLVDEKVS